MLRWLDAPPSLHLGVGAYSDAAGRSGAVGEGYRVSSWFMCNSRSDARFACAPTILRVHGHHVHSWSWSERVTLEIQLSTN